jgi:hypothetical protein
MDGMLAMLRDIAQNDPLIVNMMKEHEELRDPKVIFSAFGRMNKLYALNAIQRIHPGVFPAGHLEREKRKRKHVKAVLIPQGEGFLYEVSVDVKIPLNEDGSYNPIKCSTAILGNVFGRDVYELLETNQRTLVPNVTVLHKMNLTIVSCVDPRRNGNLDELGLGMIPFDNFIPSLYHMAENDFDLTLVRDFFGPVLIFHNANKDLRASDLVQFHRSYFGGFSDILPYLTRDPLPAYVKREYKAQRDGKKAVTDLYHQNVLYPGFGDWACGRCGCLLARPVELSDPDEPPRPKSLKCGKCRATKYCSRGCQVAHWPVHRRMCVKAV